jgi:hypothetical protein
MAPLENNGWLNSEEVISSESSPTLEEKPSNVQSRESTIEPPNKQILNIKLK